MDTENSQHEEKLSDIVDIQAKVMAYLTECGVDTTTVSVEDIDGKSLSYLAEWAENNDDNDTDHITMKHDEGNIEGVSSPLRAVAANSQMELTAFPPVSTGLPQNSNDALLQSIQNQSQEQRGLPKQNESIEQLNADIQALSEKQLEIQRLKLMATSLKSLIATSDNQKRTAKNGQNYEGSDCEYNINDMEPWQRALFKKIDVQTEAIERCQAQIEALANIVALNMASGKEHASRGVRAAIDTSAQTQQTNSDIFHADANVNPNDAIAYAANENQNLSLIETVMEKFLYVPRTAHAYITTTRIFRIIAALQQEANNFRIPGNHNQRLFDLQLLFKLAFICMFLRARIGSNERRGYASKDVEGFLGQVISLWRSNSALFLGIAAAMVYFLQTGLFVFMYRVFVKDNVIGRILRNEDLEDARARNSGDGVNVNGIEEARQFPQRRRGRRDRAPLQNENHDANANAENDHDNDRARHNQNQNQNLIPRQNRLGQALQDINVEETFIRGVIDAPFARDEAQIRNIPREEVFLGHMIDGLKDVLYLFGSFFMSLFPMWRPRVREREDVHHLERVHEDHDEE